MFEMVNHLCEDTQPLLKLPGLLVQRADLASQFAKLPIESRKSFFLPFMSKRIFSHRRYVRPEPDSLRPISLRSRLAACDRLTSYWQCRLCGLGATRCG